MMLLRFAGAITVALCSLCITANVEGAATPYYQGKSIRIIVGAAPGGGYDAYARVIARHLGRHVPGNPAIVVENMAGAGSLIAANHTYKVAKPDGLTIGHFIGGLVLQQVMGKPGIEFDGRKFQYLGVPAQDNTVLGIASNTGFTSPEQWIASNTALKFGGVGPVSAADDIPKVAMATIGLPVQLVTGYKGTSLIRLAFNNGEIQGLANSWESFKSTWRREVETSELRIILQALSKRHPELPNVPLIIDYAKTAEAKTLVEVGINNYGATARPFVLPPGTPKDRVELMRNAFTATMTDPEFIADAKKAALDLNPLTGVELEKTIASVYKLDARLVDKLKTILK
jgi:tripartite-type tricarboxylate transporter receptor subunit TctC